MWGDLRTWPVWRAIVAGRSDGATADRYLTNIQTGRAQAVGLIG